jgi:hypothetical protein
VRQEEARAGSGPEKQSQAHFFDCSSLSSVIYP